MTFPRKLPDADKNAWHHEDFFSQGSEMLAKSLAYKDYEINMHAHDFFELNLVLKGKGAHYVENNIFEIETGDLFIMQPGVKHGYFQPEGLDVQHLLIHRAFFSKYGKELETLPGYIMLFIVEPVFSVKMNYRNCLKLSRKNMLKVAGYLQEIARLETLACLENHLLVNTMALYVMSWVCTLYRQQYRLQFQSKEIDTYFLSISKCIDHISKAFTSRISVEELVKSSNMSRSTFFRVFSKVTGYSPAGFINHYRIREARKLLLGSGRSITEIGQELGFFDESHFDHAFKKENGISPGEYRKLYHFSHSRQSGHKT